MGNCNEVVLVDGPVTLIEVVPDPDTTLVDAPSLTVLVQPDAEATLVDDRSILILESDGGSGPAGPPGAGVVTTVVAGATVQAFRVVALDASDLAYMPSASVLAESDALLGISLSAALTGESLNVQIFGRLATPAMWTPGPLWLGAAGMLTSVPPVADVGLQVAYAATPSVLIVRPQSLFVLG